MGRIELINPNVIRELLDAAMKDVLKDQNSILI